MQVLTSICTYTKG